LSQNRVGVPEQVCKTLVTLVTLVTLAVVVFSVGCGDDDSGDVDAAVVIDAAVNAPDAAAGTDAPAGVDAAAVDGAVVDAAGVDAAAPADAAAVDAAAPADASDVDASLPVDAGPIDAAVCAAPLNPLDDGSSATTTAPPVVISEINPGDYIEVYNRTATAVDFSVGPFNAYEWCSPFLYADFTPGVTVPPLSYAVVDWPSGFDGNATDGGGQIILYPTASFEGANMLDFVCWGTGSLGRKGSAESIGKWDASAPCAPGLPVGGAIHRLPNTDGTNPADYDVTAPPSPMTCTAE
jgi:hypothetical protein